MSEGRNVSWDGVRDEECQVGGCQRVGVSKKGVPEGRSVKGKVCQMGGVSDVRNVRWEGVIVEECQV